jgi:hypothetical protein
MKKTYRYVRLTIMIAVAILAAAVVSTLTIDVGGLLEAQAERGASAYLKRPVQIGTMRLHVASGRFLMENFSIGGVKEDDRPFFSAGRLSIALDWSTVLTQPSTFTIRSVDLTDWQMLVEKWPGGQHSFPKFTRDRDEPPDEGPKGPSRVKMKYLRAWRGQFAYEDHSSPWSIVARNIDLNITDFPTYRGSATFHGGTVAIQKYVPMWANMKARFRIDGSLLHMEQLAFETDGARSSAVGVVDVSRFPEMQFDVKSRVDFQRMRELFFEREKWALSGEGDFTGTFHLFKGGHDLAGTFKSDLAGVYEYRFPALYGALHWTPKLFEVTDAGSELFDGDAKFAYSIKPLGTPTGATAHFEASYTDVDLARISDFYDLRGQRFAGRASGENLLEWPNGRFHENHGSGRVTVAMPAGSTAMPATLPPAEESSPAEWGPFAPPPMPPHLPITGELTYRLSPDRIELEGGQFATERTHVRFEGSTAWGDESAFRFHVTSGDWQESDQLLAGILTDFGSPTRAVTFGGRGEFDGMMTGAFRRPRVEGLFTGENLRAWDTVWGSGSGRIVVENSYVTVRDSSIRLGGSEIRADGRFSLGYPRRDGGEEIDARFRVTRRNLDGVRHAFEIDDYPVSGLLTGEFHLTGAYERPIGFGSMTIEQGVAYSEPFEKGTAALRFDGTGVRLDSASITKSTGTVTGAAFVGWDGTYSFNAIGRRIPMAGMTAFAHPKLLPEGVVEFSAGGSGQFEAPRYDVKFRIADLTVSGEPVGLVNGTLALRAEELSGELDITSSRLAVTGTGRIQLNTRADAELSFRFHESSLDPYVRLFMPTLSPYTTAVASGSMRVVGELADVNQLVIDGTVDSVEMRLFDYVIRNGAPIKLALDRNVIRVNDLQLVGDDTKLKIGGTIGLQDQRIALQAVGDANLGILQGFFPNEMRGSGRAELMAAVNGPLAEPEFSGTATITNGRIRHFSMPNSLDAINGVVRFDSRGIGLDDVTATMGGGRIQFGGRIGLDGYLPGELNVTARGESLQLRVPEGVRSVVDADLSVRGNVKAPTLGGTITVRSAMWNRRIDPTAGLFDFGSGSAGGATEPGAAAAVPIRFDLEVNAPATVRIENNLARLVVGADLQLRGTSERPLLLGRAEVDRGEILFEGRRYLVTRGILEFNNPTRIEPFFDVEAETRVRVPDQTYRVIVNFAGTTQSLVPQFSSDPPLASDADVVALLFSEVRREGDAELRARQNPNERQADILTTRATQLLASPISSEVGRVVEQTFGVDTFQVTPSLFDPYNQSTNAPRINPSARVTIGKRVSDRVYLTFSRSVSSSLNDQILMIEYDESDRLSWILSRNENDRYAIEVRVRHTF